MTKLYKNSILINMRYLDEEILKNQIEYQKNKMYSLSEKYGLSSPEVLEQSIVVDALINQVMRFRLNRTQSLHVTFSSSI